MAEDVQAAVSVARERGTPLSYRGVGHEYNCNGFKKDSLNIDMRSMGSGVTIEHAVSGETYMHLQPGARTSDMKQALADDTSGKPLTFTYGSCNSVGAYGYLLHGGWGPMTANWANESIVAMDVVTADGSMVHLSALSNGSEADLWRAMRVAGSSFGIVTNIIIELTPTHPRRFLGMPTVNSFDELMSAIPDEPPSFGWLGIARWDSHFFDQTGPVGSGWGIQIALHDQSASQETLDAVQAWLNANNLTSLIPLAVGLDADEWFQGAADEWMWKKGPFPTAGLFTRFYSNAQVREVAILLKSFFEPRASECRFNLGPIKGAVQPPGELVTLECNTDEAIFDLKAFIAEHADLLQPNKPGSGYVNLPLDGSREYYQVYWPQYEQLEATKAAWDPEDLFFIENGIHATKLTA
jgi:hypothetical protein